MGKKSGPDAKGAAQAQGTADRRTARDVTYADRPDQTNPWGSLNWTTEQVIDPATGEKVTKWNQDQTLNSETQGLYDTSIGMMQGRSDLAGGMMGRINQEMGGDPNFDQFGDSQGLEFDPSELRQRAEDDAYNKETSRLDPRFESRGDELMIDLRNRGLREGDQAYDSAMLSLGKERNDAYEQARLGATATGRQESGQLYNQQMDSTKYANSLRDKKIKEYVDKRGFSLNEQNKLKDGQSVSDLNTLAGV